MKQTSHLNFSITMNRLFHKIMVMDRAEKFCYGVTIPQAFTIDILSRRDSVTMNELSLELGVAISTLTRIIDVLARDEIVCRKSCEGDRRKVLICLTEKGRDLAGKLQKCTLQFWAKIFESIPNNKREDISSNLRMLLKALESADKSICSQ